MGIKLKDPSGIRLKSRQIDPSLTGYSPTSSLLSKLCLRTKRRSYSRWYILGTEIITKRRNAPDAHPLYVSKIRAGCKGDGGLSATAQSA